ncbi:putative ankyrin repeat-containing domain superfamily [Helianthus annuus]|uniref:Ankyrin repeat-containing domain superfamily n=1 Tax=Helianthus annuus TaxID=4232 RepID=A0A9K3J099_HELAN|nr:putative ankyrin repeat-containing domain superfamily [Helianthus annuus]KAJ0584745.1 putative ankyrin repeat-containing domain superfamily [Helianthus annuus]KAJ0919156.1 putative ankyrin repeat-containing domain superfamily [Helianthus annuus]
MVDLVNLQYKSGHRLYQTEYRQSTDTSAPTIWKTDDKRKTIFHLAVKRRHIEIYKLLYEIGAMKDLITPIKDIKDNNMLHMVAKSCKPNRLQDVPGPALQMQRELLWFKVFLPGHAYVSSFFLYMFIHKFNLMNQPILF